MSEHLNMADIESLAASLATTGQPTITLLSDEGQLVSAALLELIASQTVIAKQTRLLQLHGELRSRIDTIAKDAIELVTNRLDTPNPVQAYDFESAEAARRELLASTESANTTRATLAAALRFVKVLIAS